MIIRAQWQRWRRHWKRWTIGLLGLVVSIGLGAWLLFLQPLWLLTSLSPLICPQAVYAIATDHPVIALTIDDGPDISTTVDQSTTTQMLDLLRHYQSQATFFLISQKLNDSTPARAIAQRMVNEGHELGNHFTQDIRSITASATEFEQGLQAAEQTLATFSPALSNTLLTKWFRPAGGWCSQSNAQVTQSHYYQTALGTIWPYDTHLPSVAFARQQILRTVHPGAIIILHDSDKREGKSDRGQRAVQILQTVLPELQARGYAVTTLSDLATYGPVVRNQRSLPQAINRVWQRAIAGGLITSLTTMPTMMQWGIVGAISMVGAIAILIIGVRWHFLRYQWAIANPNQSIIRFYSQVTALAFFFPALVEETIFRVLLLPRPGEITGVLSWEQWGECAVSLVLYVAVHPLINGPLRDRIWGKLWSDEGRSLAYTRTFYKPTFLVLTTMVGMVCTALYLLSGSIWPSILFHWWIVTAWLLGFSGYQTLHPWLSDQT